MSRHLNTSCSREKVSTEPGQLQLNAAALMGWAAARQASNSSETNRPAVPIMAWWQGRQDQQLEEGWKPAVIPW